MSKIHVLDSITIDKIAAGEVVERPASVVKELVENAIDAGAGSVTVEIKDGGITFMRISDNGMGIGRDDVRNAFLRHSTSKIKNADDLTDITSLGFRGEALSSIAAVSQVELLTKTKEDLYGSSYRISGGKEEAFEEASAPDGTTFIIRQLFYNTPARRKFLKTPMTEGNHIADLMSHMALSHPEISFRFINNGQVKLHTSGNGNLKDVIYHIFGREITSNLLEIDYRNGELKLKGFIGAPLISRGNRNFENYFVNGRYIKSNLIAKGIEDAYKEYMMQHRYPFTVLHIYLEGSLVDVNVHPAKMELRFENQQALYNMLLEAIGNCLSGKQLIPEVEIPSPKIPEAKSESSVPVKSTPFSNRYADRDESHKKPVSAKNETPNRDLSYYMEKMQERVKAYHANESMQETKGLDVLTNPVTHADRIRETMNYAKKESYVHNPITGKANNISPKKETDTKQLNLFEEKLLTPQAKEEHKIIGQLFDTYWLIEYKEQLFIIDQHAAHEKVLYEKTMAGLKTREYTSQMINPPIVLNLTSAESQNLRKYMDRFTSIGFEFEEFGQDSFLVRAVPDNLFSIAKKELLTEMIDSLSEDINDRSPAALIDEKIASMSCKAAVKGNMKLSLPEIDTLITDLLSLENPYHCPHGRPTIISMSKRELEKKFKRIV